MHVTLAGFVLFLHIAVAISAFMMAAVMHAAMPAMARARTIAEIRPWARVVHRLDPLFPVVALLLLGLGSWLIHLEGDEGIGWSNGWIITAVTTLVVLEAAAGSQLAPRAKKIVETVENAPEGPVSDELHRATLSPFIWHTGHIATFGFLGIVFLMAAKPAGWLAVVAVVVAAGIGLALSTVQLRALGSAGTGAVPAQRVGAEATETV